MTSGAVGGGPSTGYYQPPLRSRKRPRPEDSESVDARRAPGNAAAVYPSYAAAIMGSPALNQPANGRGLPLSASEAAFAQFIADFLAKSPTAEAPTTAADNEVTRIMEGPPQQPTVFSASDIKRSNNPMLSRVMPLHAIDDLITLSKEGELQALDTLQNLSTDELLELFLNAKEGKSESIHQLIFIAQEGNDTALTALAAIAQAGNDTALNALAAIAQAGNSDALQQLAAISEKHNWNAFQHLCYIANSNHPIAVANLQSLASGNPYVAKLLTIVQANNSSHSAPQLAPVNALPPMHYHAPATSVEEPVASPESSIQQAVKNLGFAQMKKCNKQEFINKLATLKASATQEGDTTFLRIGLVDITQNHANKTNLLCRYMHDNQVVRALRLCRSTLFDYIDKSTTADELFAKIFPQQQPNT